MEKSPYRHSLILLPIVIITCLIYANSFQGKFVYDDHAMVVTYDLVKSPANIPKAFISPTSIYGNTNYYRPLQTVSYIIDYFLWGKYPFGFHLTNLLIHLASVIALYILTTILFRRRFIAAGATLLFAIHPAHTAVVSYIAGRADALLAVCALASIAAYIRAVYSERAAWPYPVSIAFFCLALLTKELALIIPVFLILFDALLVRWTALGRRDVAPLRYLPYLVLTGIYLAFRFTFMNFSVPGAIEPFPLANRLMTVPYWIVQYLRIIIIPNDLHIERLPWVARSFFDGRIVVSLGLLILAGGILWRYRNAARPAVFGALWFLICLFPSLNIMTPLFSTLADNWLYLPSAGIFMVLAFLIEKAYGAARANRLLAAAVMLAAAAYAASLAAITVAHNRTWGDEIAVGENTTRFNPYAFKIFNNMGVAYLGRGEFDKAEASFKRCLAIKPDTGMAYFNLYRIAIARGDREEAKRLLKRARELDPQEVEIVVQKLHLSD